MEHVLGTAPHPSHCLFEPEGDQPHSRKLLVLYRDSGRLCLLNRIRAAMERVGVFSAIEG